MLSTTTTATERSFRTIQRFLMTDIIEIRESTDSDITKITEIYANEVLTGLASFEVQPPTKVEMAERRQQLIASGYPYLVATSNDEIVGYSYVGPYRSRPAYQHTLENSVYVAINARRQGVGRMLLTALIQRCKQGSWHTMVAVIGDTSNIASISLHAKCGFNNVGTLKSVGHKHGRWVDSVVMQLML